MVSGGSDAADGIGSAGSTSSGGTGTSSGATGGVASAGDSGRVFDSEHNLLSSVAGQLLGTYNAKECANPNRATGSGRSASPSSRIGLFFEFPGQ